MIKMSTYLTQYKLGDYVDIKCNPAQVKGMPFKHYHGRTGQVYNVTKRAVGVRVAKQVNGRIINKHLNVRVEHVIPSKCRDDLKARVARNEELKKAARAGGARAALGGNRRSPRAASRSRCPRRSRRSPVPTLRGAAAKKCRRYPEREFV